MNREPQLEQAAPESDVGELVGSQCTAVATDGVAPRSRRSRREAVALVTRDVTAMRTCVRMLEHRYSETEYEYDPERSWIVLGSSRGQVTLPDDASF